VEKDGLFKIADMSTRGGRSLVGLGNLMTASEVSTLCIEQTELKIALFFPPHLTGVSTLLGETGNPEIVFLLKCCMLFCQQTHKTLKYHQVSVKPPFTIKTIEYLHQTGPIQEG